MTETDQAQQGAAVKRDIAYELILIDGPDKIDLGPGPHLKNVDTVWMEGLRRNSAVGRAALSANRNSKKQVLDRKITVREEIFRIVHAADLVPYNSTEYSEAAAHEALERLVRANPALEDTLQIVPAYEADPVALVGTPIQGYVNLTKVKPSKSLLNLKKMITQ
ncbi:MAG: hypothetical protein IPM36_24300 [Lewinellaceae bacterium]|nr:hypothetical protein [Lewinellaceae bacterium]